MSLKSLYAFLLRNPLPPYTPASAASQPDLAPAKEPEPPAPLVKRARKPRAVKLAAASTTAAAKKPRGRPRKNKPAPLSAAAGSGAPVSSGNGADHVPPLLLPPPDHPEDVPF